MLTVKILGLQHSQRYILRRLVLAAQQELQAKGLPLELDLLEGNDAGEIGKYACVLVLPTLVINEKVVCSGRIPTRQEVTGWLLEAAQ